MKHILRLSFREKYFKKEVSFLYSTGDSITFQTSNEMRFIAVTVKERCHSTHQNTWFLECKVTSHSSQSKKAILEYLEKEWTWDFS